MKTQITSALAQEQSNIFVDSLSSIIKTQLLTKTVIYNASEWPWLVGGGGGVTGICGHFLYTKYKCSLHVMLVVVKKYICLF